MNTGTCKFLSELGIKTMEPCNCKNVCEKLNVPVHEAVPVADEVRGQREVVSNG